MGRRLTPSEEVQQLRQATREAHEAIQGVRDAIRDANRLYPTLVSEFERLHHREMEQLSAHFTSESNRHSADLNATVHEAKKMIFNQIMAGELVLDPERGTITLRLGSRLFDDQQAVPPTTLVTRETTQ